jgi:hypothetical protein
LRLRSVDRPPCARAAGLAALAFGAAQLAHSRALARAAISRRLVARARALGGALLLAPLGSAALCGVSTLFRPRTLWFEVLLAADFVAVVAAAAAAALALAVIPSVEAASAGAAIGWGEPGWLPPGSPRTSASSLLQPLLGGGEGAHAEGGVGEGAPPATPVQGGGASSAARSGGGGASSTGRGGGGGGAGVPVSAGATRRTLLSAATPGSAESTPRSAPGSAGSAGSGARYYSPYG